MRRQKQCHASVGIWSALTMPFPWCSHKCILSFIKRVQGL